MTSVEIKRERMVVYHTARAKTAVREEFTLLSHRDGVNNVFISKSEFLPNLKAVDSDGEELPIVPNEQTLKLLQEDLKSAPKEDVDGIRRLVNDIQAKRIHIIWVKLPPGKTLQRSQYRVLSLEYDSSRKKNQSSKIMIHHKGDISHSMYYTLKRPVDYEFRTGEARLVGHDGKLKNFDLASDNPLMDRVETSDDLLLIIKPGAVREMTVRYSFRPARNTLVFPCFAISLLSAAAILVGAANW